MAMTHTHTYSVLEVAWETFSDIEKRLRAVGCAGEYLDRDTDGSPLIVLGTVALTPERPE
jgi:hypothetical protein